MTFKRAGPARPTKVGGEVAPFPLRYPFRFHACRFPSVSALRSLHPPPFFGLSPEAPTEGTNGGDPGPSRRVRREGGARPRPCRSGGRGGGRGALPPNGPRREAPNLYRLPLAHTNPDVAVCASRCHMHRGPSLAPAIGLRPLGAAKQGILEAVVFPRPQPPDTGGGQPKAGQRQVEMPSLTFLFRDLPRQHRTAQTPPTRGVVTTGLAPTPKPSGLPFQVGIL